MSEENQKELKVLELFGGIGAIRKAFERQHIPHKVVDYVEIDDFAVKSYNAMYGTNFEPQDISKWDKDIEVDFIMHGSPCQDFSIAGLQKGGDEGSGTRSSLMYETIRLVKKLNPSYVVWENVKNLVSDKHYHNFRKYLNTMEDFGYNNYYQVLNAKDYGIPQNRERVFTVSIRKDIDHKQFYFPEKQPLEIRLKDLLETNVDEKYYLSDEKINSISQWKSYQKPLESVLGNNSISPTLTARGAGEEHAGMITYSDEFNDTTNVQEQLDGVNRLGGLYDTETRQRQSGAIYDKEGLAPTLSTGHGLDRPFIIDDIEKPNKVLQENITQIVKVRKFPVNTTELQKLLKESKANVGITNEVIANKLHIPVTQVEHYFRTDDSFAIPSPEIWLDLKSILNINNNEFDESIMTFEEKESTYDMQNRAYHIDGIAPTLDTNSDKKIIEYKGKEVELPAVCASRGRNLENPTNRTPGQKLEQTIEINTDGVSNTLTTVQKDNYIIDAEPQVLKRERTEFGKAIRKEYEAGNTDLKREDVTQYVPRTDSISNTITTVQKDNYVVENPPTLQFVGSIKDKDIVGDNKNLSRNSSIGDRVYDSNGVATTISAQGGGIGSHSGLYTVDDNDPDIDNPLKGISGQSWQFEQNVYSEDSKCIRTIKAGEGSGNIPKVIENPQEHMQQLANEINKNAKHQQDFVQTENDDYDRTIVAGTHGNASTGDHLKTVVRENDDRNKKQQLCDYMVKNNLVEPYDVINHGYTEHRFESLKNQNDIIMSKNMAPTITTRPDELGVAVETKSVFTDTDAKMITEDGNVKRYIDSDIVDKFEDGQIADISFPNGYNKGPRVHNECPTINGTTVQSFITKEDNNVIIGSKRENCAKSENGIVPTLTAGMGTGGGNIPMHNYGLRIRKLTPRECWRLMGFDDEDFDRAEKVNSNAQLYKQAGNSIVVNVLEAIINSMFRPDPNLPKRKFVKKLF